MRNPMKMSNLVKEFREFAIKGNMIDIAIGVIIGAAFNKVIDALVKQILLPPLTLLTGGLHWGNKKIILREAGVVDGQVITEVAMGYGTLIEALIDFLIIGVVVFAVVKLMNTIRRRSQDPKDKTVETPKDIELLDRIADLLEQQNALLDQRQTNDQK